jgi:hypothetical protein
MRSRTLFSIDRSRSRSNVAVPASAVSSSNATSPLISDWDAAKVFSSRVSSCSWSSARSVSRRVRSSSSSFFVSGEPGAADFAVAMAVGG